MLVQRRIQEEIHGNKPTPKQTNGFHHDSPKPSPIEQKISHSRQSHSEEKFVSSSTNDQQKKSFITNTSIDRISPLSEDDDMSTNEIVARNQSSKLDFHKTMTPMIGKENFELRKKLFENPDDSSFAGKYISNISLNRLLFFFFFVDVVPCFNDTSKSSSRQSLNFLTYENIPWKLKIRKEIFSPNETFDQPILINLLYLQIVRDTFSSICIRISEAERTNMKTILCKNY